MTTYNIFKEIASWFKSIHKKEEAYIEMYKCEDEPLIVNVPKEEEPTHCQCKGCNNKLTLIDTFLCRYCGKKHCGVHRLPELHGCPNPSLPLAMRKHWEARSFK